MPALDVGTVAPEFTLPLVNGGEISLRDALKRGPVVAAFFKISCPVCQLAFPYIERLYDAYRGKSVTILGISQNDMKGTKQFAADYDPTFPLLLDDARSYPVSNAYGLTNVPSVFYISPEGEVELSMVGWDRKEMERLSVMVAHATGAPAAQIFHPGEDVPQFKAG